MEHIRIAKVENVCLLHHGGIQHGTLHLTAHHMIFNRTDQAEQGKSSLPSEMWIAYPIIAMAYRYPPSASSPAHLRLRNRDFSFVQFRFESERECRDVFDTVRSLAVIKGNIEKLYAFFYQPMPHERRYNGWKLYNSMKEFERMGVGTERCKGWRITHINRDFSFSPTYPAILAVPATISDTTLTHAKSYRSRARIPALTYIHPLNNCTITRCAQPLTGVRGNRSIQDEKLVAAIFASSQPPGSLQTPSYLRNSTPPPSGSSSSLGAQPLENAGPGPTSEPDVPSSPVPVGRIYGAQQRSLIVDARPTVNAYAMQVIGLGSEDMDNYKHCSSPPCSKTYLGIDNIHVMRDSLHKVIDAIKDTDITPLPPSRELLAKSGWLKHIGLLLEGTAVIVRQIAVEHAHVLVHCSDGWDRTSQLSSLAQICLDPYFRTIDGFITLVEKDWVSFGHRFRDRGGYLGHEKWFVEKTVYGQQLTDETQAEDDDDIAPRGGSTASSLGGAGAAAAFGEAFGQAKNFFNNVAGGVGGAAGANGRSVSPNPAELDGDSFDVVDRRTKLARASEGGGGTTPPLVVTKPKDVSPTFQQFLDGTYQLMAQYPTRFEYNERFLRRLFYHLYSCQYGTFLHNNDKERFDGRVKERTRSVWDYFLLRRKLWVNDAYDPDADSEEHVRELEGGRVIFPRTGPGAVKWWASVWGRKDEEMNGPLVNPIPRNASSAGIAGVATAPMAPADSMQLPSSLPGSLPTISLPGAALSGISGMVEGVQSLALGTGGSARTKESEVESLGVEMM